MAFNLGRALLSAFGETALMVLPALALSVLLGGSIGLLLFATENPLFIKNKAINQVVGFVVNIVRSIPFLILLVLLIPLSKLVVHTSIGPKSVIVPLAIAAVAFYARLAEASFSDVSKGVLEAALACGATKVSIVIHILIPEALPQLVKNVTITAISLVGFSAMAGTVGGGGIGDLAIRYGYQRYQTEVMIVCVVALVILVQALQLAGDWAARGINKK